MRIKSRHALTQIDGKIILQKKEEDKSVCGLRAKVYLTPYDNRTNIEAELILIWLC